MASYGRNMSCRVLGCSRRWELGRSSGRSSPSGRFILSCFCVFYVFCAMLACAGFYTFYLVLIEGPTAGVLSGGWFRADPS